MVRNIELIEAAGMKNPAAIVLSDESSMWKSVVYIFVADKMKRRSGNCFTTPPAPSTQRRTGKITWCCSQKFRAVPESVGP